MTLLARLAIAVVCTGAFSFPVLAQQPASPNNSSAPASTQSQAPQAGAPQPLSSEDVLKQEEKQRALGIVPMFGMTSVKNAPPLSSKQKFQLMARTMIDPFNFVSAGLTAGLGQATNSFAGYGQGAAGFGKRYAAALADNADSNFFSNYFYPVLFKQDPRYFRVGEGSIKKRTWTALEEEFVARKDSGGQTFHFSNVLGAITAGTTFFSPASRLAGDRREHHPRRRRHPRRRLHRPHRRAQHDRHGEGRRKREHPEYAGEH